MNNNSIKNWKFSLLFQLVSISSSTFFPIFWLSIGLSNVEVASLDSLAFIFSLSGPILVLLFLPKFNTKKFNGITFSALSLVIAGISGILIGVGDSLAYKFELFSVLVTALGISSTAIPLVAVNSMGQSSNFGKDYGSYRMYGSYGFMAGLILSGVVSDFLTTRLIPIVCGCSCLFSSYYLFRVLKFEEIQKVESANFLNTKQIFSLLYFFIFQVLIWAGFSAVFRYMPLRMKEMGATSIFISLTLLILGVSALLSMKKIGQLTDKFPIKKTWFLVPIFSFLRIIFISLPSSNLLWFFPIQLLHIPTWVLNDILTMRFLHEKKQELGGLIIAVCTQLSNGLGLSLGSYIMSHYIADYGLRSSFFWISFVPLTGIFVLPLLKNRISK